ncbi:transposase [Marinospirillum sp.]
MTKKRRSFSPEFKQEAASLVLDQDYTFAQASRSLGIGVGHELFAIDGCKMRSNAAKEWSGTFKELKEKRNKLKHLVRHHLNEHQERDTWESEEELDQDIRKAQTILTLNEAAEKVDCVNR